MDAQAAASGSESELVFQQSVEGLFQIGLKGQVTPELVARLRAAGLDLARPLAPAYSREVWERCLQVTAELLWRGEPPERAYHRLGRCLIEGFAETLMGRALVGIVRLVGPRRTLERMTRNLRSGCNYSATHVTDAGPAEVLLWVNEARLPPAYVAGLLEATLAFAGARGVDIQVHARDKNGCTYRVRWDA
jgi:uncharacterized protein (TIGR02265 family)